MARKLVRNAFITKKQLAYLSKKYGKNNCVYGGRFIENPIDQKLGINICINEVHYKMRDVTPFEIKKYIGAVEDWAKGLANVLEKDLNSKSFYK